MNRKKIGYSIIVFIGLYLIVLMLFPHSTKEYYYTNFSFKKVIFDLVSTSILSISIVEVCFWIDRKVNKWLPWTKQPTKRLLVQSLLQILSVLLFLILFLIITYMLMVALDIQYEPEPTNKYATLYLLVSTIFLTLLISTINTINYLSTNWKDALISATEQRISAAESKQLVAETELQALRVQLDPHFVFNNLSVLSELILQNQQLGFEYTENFSKVYRYLLINSKKDLINLEEELKFLNAYIFLLENRIGSGVQFKIAIPSNKMDYMLPPLTLQLLVENAIKHNRIDKNNPLLINIYTEENNILIVENNLLPLMKKPISSGFGLENINRRYALLSTKKPEIVHTALHFKVSIPLI